jgi:hypothetical protein
VVYNDRVARFQDDMIALKRMALVDVPILHR